jgi:hypothetical protein
MMRALLALSCAALCLAGLAAWPLPVWPLALAILLAGGLIWWRPFLWIVLLPPCFPLFDLSPWSGWMMLGEPDLILLAALAVLILREPPATRSEMRPLLLPLGAMSAALLISAGIGLAVPEPPGGSDLVYLSRLDTLRLAKPWAEVLLLSPFLPAAIRRGEALAWGLLLLGLGVAISAGVERGIFVGVFDFASDYRVVGTFSSMHIGGGHIGAALALTLAAAVALSGSPWRLVALAALPALLYGLAVTYARTAYAAALAGMLVAALAVAMSGWRAGLSRLGSWPLLTGMSAALLLFVAALASPMMASRFTSIGGDLQTREANWQSGLALEGGDWTGWLVGHGLGSFPRLSAGAAQAAGQPTGGPSYYRLRDGALQLVSRTPLYLGHRVDGVASGEMLDLALRWRSMPVDPASHPGVATAGGLGIGLCEKLLLYSLDCAGGRQPPGEGWRSVALKLVAPGHANRPLELSFTTDAGAVIEVADVHLRDAAGRELLANGDFHEGLARWFFTDDNHLVWRMKNQALMTLFETGLIGLAALLLLIAAALRGAWRAVCAGDGAMAAAVAGGVAAFLVSSLFDAVLEAPRLAFVIYLLLAAGAALVRPKGVRPKGVRPEVRAR